MFYDFIEFLAKGSGFLELFQQGLIVGGNIPRRRSALRVGWE
jgi:hypothetical protein